MQTREIIRTAIDDKLYLRRTPERTDYKELITTDTIFIENGKPIILYKILPKTYLDKLRYLVFKSKFIKTHRTNGTPSQSAVFGALPRIPHRHNYCRYSANTKNQKELNSDIFYFARLINSIYRDLLPDQHEINLSIVEESVEAEYVIKGTPFTTVNLNINHAIKYHRDTGNFKNVFSNVLILKDGVAGGFLVCPEFEIAFGQQDGALILFDGQNIIHGVTPIKMKHDKAYRCSCVFYALADMKNCYPYKLELERVKKWRDTVESRFRPDPKAFK
ncbi:MAG TPA: hypothetical protein VFO76_12880 [Candidatus Kapabacteria bacterium]|nr:hypothetical protein [Candidatus Kapabacteria bacterium]